jgi:hypothetical protein
MRHTFLPGLLLLVLSLSTSLAAPAQKSAVVKTSGSFSDIFVSRESGDVGGTELFFFENGDSNYVIITNGEGELRPPQISKVQIGGNNLQFAMQGLDSNLRPALLQFRGTFSAARLAGKFSNGHDLSLPRKTPRFMTTYSDMVEDRARGKVVGSELITFLADKHYVLLLLGRQQMVFGEANIQGTTLQFNIRNSDGTKFSFQGKATKTSVSGTLTQDGYASPFKLPAKKSFWQ